MFLSKKFHRVTLSKRYRTSVNAIPNLFTFANAVCGFLAVIFAFEGTLMLSASCIILAAICDGLDGRLARVLNACSPFGKELDSLCDAVSFCLAPALVLYSAYFIDSGILSIVALSVYVCSGLFRLARFNVQSGERTGYFSGLPVPIAACLLASIVLYHEWLAMSCLPGMFRPVFVCMLLLVLGFLMSSSIPFPSFKQYQWSRRNILQLIIGSAFVMVAFLGKMPIFLLVTLLYVLISLVKYVITGAK